MHTEGALAEDPSMPGGFVTLKSLAALKSVEVPWEHVGAIVVCTLKSASDRTLMEWPLTARLIHRLRRDECAQAAAGEQHS